MEDYKNLLSIIIPTKNRYECLIPVILAISKYVYGNDIEVIVQDNSDNNAKGLTFFNQFNDSRIKYFYSSESLSIQDNTIHAINNSTGKYLIFIGDDDLVFPDIYTIVQYLCKNNIECLVYNAAYYWWNSVDFKKEDHFHRKNALWIPLNPSIHMIKRDTEHELQIMLESGSGMFSRLPKFYHGIVTRNILDKIKEATGTYLPGSSPDIAFSTSLSLVLKEYYYINFPVSVFGASRNSGGGMTARKQHFGKIEDQKFLPKETIKNWNNFIPRIWSEKSIYAQTVTEVLKAFKSPKKFNYLSFYGTMLAYEPYLLRFILPVIKSYCKFNIVYYLMIIIIYFKKRLGILFRKFRFSTRTYQYDVLVLSDVNLVMETLKEYHKEITIKL